MATARELLEQADALMRRNRSRADPASGAVLMTEIPAAERAAAAKESRRDARISDDFDDIPVLTDAITDREPISLLGPDEGGEPSRWPEDSAVREPRSDEWWAMGSSAVTRAAESARAAALSGRDESPSARDESADDAPGAATAALDESDASNTTTAALGASDASGATTAVRDASDESTTTTAASRVADASVDPSVATAARALADAPDAPVATSDTPDDQLEMELAEALNALNASVGASAEELQRRAADDAKDAEAPEPQAAAVPSKTEVFVLTDEPPVAPLNEDESSTPSDEANDADDAPHVGVDLACELDTVSATTAREDDSARWAALAEEVRMQVLQRLDIFTDTGLQEQLSARLQPIVDRASADLVGAINLHLGALLRSYVAEAIEREIEKLRRGAA